MKNRDFKDSRLIDAFSYIDPKYIAEVTDSLKLPDGKNSPFPYKKRGWRHIAALAACLLLLGAVIPMITYVLRHYPDIAAYFSGETTETSDILTEPETPPEESTVLTPDTSAEETTEPLYDGTTAEPEPEHNGSYGLVYKMNEDGKSAMLWNRGTCTDENVIIASVWNGVPVTVISEAALADYIKYKTVTVPESVTKIDMRAFKNCTGLERINLHGGITYIGADAFENCPLLREIILPESLEQINTGLFANCINLQKVVIDKSVKKIVSGAFYECTSLTELHYIGTKTEWNAIQKDETWNVGSAIEIIHCSDGDIIIDISTQINGTPGLEYRNNGKYASIIGIGTCTEKDIVIASEYEGVPVTTVAKHAFKNANINTVHLPDSINTIENEAFIGSSLTKIQIPSSVKKIGECAFSGCTELKTAILSEGVTEIMLEAFYHCTSLTELSLPSTLEIIGSWAFAECENLKSVRIPDSVIRISDLAFGHCRSLTDLNLGNGVEQIMPEAFMYCTSLESVTVPGSVKEISNSAFAGCSKLRDVTISRGIEKLGFWIFSDCLMLDEIAYTGTKSEWSSVFVPEEAFGNIIIKRIRCSDGDIILVETDPEQGSPGLEYRAFGDYAVLVGIGTCSDRDVVIATIYQGLPVTEIWHEAFVGVKGMRSVRIPEGVTYIESHAFENCTDLRAVYLPASLENVVGSLMTHGFYNCPTIETIEIAEGGKKYYSTDNCLIERETGTLVFGCGKSSIPADGSIKAIGEYAFNGCRNLVSLALPAGVIHIRTGAFSGCEALRTLTLPNSLVTIRQNAFENCTSLSSLTIPESVTEIYNGAFRGCSNLKSVTLPSSLTLIDSEAFLGTAIESIVIPKNVKELGAVFSECEKLTSVILPEGFESFVGHTFAGCTSLKSINLPKSLKNIGMNTFYGCTALTDLRFAGTVAQWKSISKQEHWNAGAEFKVIHCTDGDVETIEYDGSRGLEYRIFGDHAALFGIGSCTDKDIVVATTYDGFPVTEINAFAFENISNITSVTVSEGVEDIGLQAFNNLPNLRAVYLPSTLESINGGEGLAFCDCQNIEIISVATNNPKFYSVGNCMIERNTGTLVFACKSSVIPTDGSIKSIGVFAFSDLQSIRNIVIPEGVTEIKQYAFSGCANLKSVTLPNSLTSIKWSAFSGCRSLESIHLSNNVKNIESGAFANCSSLREITLPAKLDYFGEEVFAASAIESIVIPSGVTLLHGGTFIKCQNLKEVTLPDGIEYIGAYAFDRCTALIDINIPASVKEIDGYAFSECPALKQITIPRNTEKIDQYAFYGCASLGEFYYLGTKAEWKAVKKGESWNEGCPFTVIHCSDGDVEAIEYDGSRGLEYKISADGTYAILVGIGTCTDKDIVVATTYYGIPVARIDSYALYNCQFIESLTIPEGVTIIHNEAFYLCKNLKKVTLPSTLEWIQDWAFAGCESLETVRIPDSVTQISIRAFSDCKNLFSLTLGAGVELIEESAFENCTSLGYVKFPKSLRLLANDAFSGCTALTNIHYAGTIQEWNSVDSTGRDYGNTHIWYEGVPGEKITCTNGYIFISAISESEAYEAAREFLGIPKSQIGGKYVFATKTKDSSHLDCYRVALCEFIPDIGHMGEYEVLREVYVNQNTGECTEIVFDYPDIPKVFHGVIFNREKFIYVDVDKDYLSGEYTYKTEENYLKTFKISGEWLFGLNSQDYSLLDIDGDSFPELIFRNVPRNIDGLILRYYDGKIYGYRWGGDGLMTDGTNPWHENAGEVQVLDLIYFDGLLIKFREIMRYDFSDPQNVKYYVEGKEVTKEEYEKTAAKYDGEYLKYSPLDLYPIYVNPFPGG